MSKNITIIYQKKWNKSYILSLLEYIRDLIINLLPFKRLPKIIVKFFYGSTIDFVFFVHPRRVEDIFIGLPFLKIIRFITPDSVFKNIIAFFPPFVLERIKSNKGINGVVISSLTLPEWLFTNHRKSVIVAMRGLRFANKIMSGHYVGLGGLWPMVTRRGWALQPYMKKIKKEITTGHCGTAISIFLMIKEMAKVANLSISQFSIAIIGVGKMGSTLAKLFGPLINHVILIDHNEVRLRFIKEELLSRNKGLSVQTINSRLYPDSVQNAFLNAHLAICATSNIRNIMRPIQVPHNCIIIDDSRPEAFPRLLTKRSKIILEGGLLKINGITLNYDYGFGIGENVFGCLAETYLLALDSGKSLKPTIGMVQEENFYKMMNFALKNGVEAGAYKTSSVDIDEEHIKRIIKYRHNIVYSKSLSILDSVPLERNV